MNVLSADDKAHFEEQGFVVVPNAVPPENLEALVSAMWEFLGMDRNNPSDWYREPLHPSSMVEMYQHPAMWANREHLRVHGAFADIFGTEKLWVSEDRVSLKPPARPEFPAYDVKGFVHWDMDTSKLPVPLGVQGVLFLTDTDENMGGFRCVPGFHRVLEEWIKEQPADRNPHSPDLSRLPPGMEVTPIAGKAGDLVIWNRLLAHGNGHNLSDRPRLAQYIAMFPAPDASNPKAEGWRQARIERWRERRRPTGEWTQGDPRRLEELHGQTAKLSPLGRKLLGLDAW